MTIQSNRIMLWTIYSGRDSSALAGWLGPVPKAGPRAKLGTHTANLQQRPLIGQKLARKGRLGTLQTQMIASVSFLPQ